MEAHHLQGLPWEGPWAPCAIWLDGDGDKSYQAPPDMSSFFLPPLTRSIKDSIQNSELVALSHMI